MSCDVSGRQCHFLGVTTLFLMSDFFAERNFLYADKDLDFRTLLLVDIIVVFFIGWWNWDLKEHMSGFINDLFLEF